MSSRLAATGAAAAVSESSRPVPVAKRAEYLGEALGGTLVERAARRGLPMVCG